MKTLKTENGKKIVLKSFETEEEFEVNLRSVVLEIIKGKEIKIIYPKTDLPGTKAKLKEKPEDFWKPLVESVFDNLGGIYKNYETMKIASTAKESGHSSLEGEGEFILITLENE